MRGKGQDVFTSVGYSHLFLFGGHELVRAGANRLRLVYVSEWMLLGLTIEDAELMLQSQLLKESRIAVTIYSDADDVGQGFLWATTQHWLESLPHLLRVLHSLCSLSINWHLWTAQYLVLANKQRLTQGFRWFTS